MTEANKFVRTEPNVLSADELSEVNDPFGVKRAVMLKKHEHHWRKIEEDKEIRQNVQYVMVKHELWEPTTS